MAYELQISAIDNVTPWLDWAIAHKPDWTRKAVKSTAWYAQQEIKKGIRSGAPGGSTYAERMSAAKRHDIEDSSKRGGSKRRRRAGVLGNLLNAVGYQFKTAQVAIGWLSRSAVRIGSWHELGIDQPITPKMRRLFFAAGVGLKASTTHIKLPSRPTYQPMFNHLRNLLPEYFRNKFISYLANGGPPQKLASSQMSRSRQRIYTVYG